MQCRIHGNFNTLYKNHMKREVSNNIKIKIQNKGKKSENSYQELKRSPRDRHTKTHGNSIEIF